MKYLVFALLVTAIAAQQCSVSGPDRIDCGYVGINQQQCQQKGCCWSPDEYFGINVGNDPWCFYPAGSQTCSFNTTVDGTAPFSDSEIATMRGYFLANINIQGSGAVVASPDPNTPGGSYYYHWMRDGALSMKALIQTSSNASDFNTQAQAYAKWVVARQSESDPHGQSVLAEPKFTIPDGAVYTGPWCRPQQDGPALRANTLITYANILLNAGQKDFVQQYLWNGQGGGAIKVDLDYVAANWQADGCDLWEEVRSNDFFWNRQMYKAGLLAGAQFAQKMGDSSSAQNYQNAANAVNATLLNHFNGDYIYESTNRQVDGSVMCALNDGDVGDNMFDPSEKMVASTIRHYNGVFCNEYSINKQDTSNGVPGIMIGRYPGDSYGGGNPWILLTAALGEVFYRAAITVKTRGSLPSADAMAVWKDVLTPLQSNPNPSPTDFAQMLFDAGDAVLKRIRYHVAGGKFHLSEQLDRNTGVETSATDLTWSYAALLKATTRRAQF